MTPAFWDTSALVPLCVEQLPTTAMRQHLESHEITVWWATSVEMRSAFERLRRMGHMTDTQHDAAGRRLESLRLGWRELQPTESLRSQAETFLATYPLKAADALQLAAAWVWSGGQPAGCVFLSADLQLLQAARQVGFQIKPV